MTITDQIKILNRKIMQNEAQYDLDRKAAKISALSSNNLDKYEYLTGEDLGLKPSTIEQTKFEYSPLGKIFNKGLDKDDKKEGLFKRLKNIENAQKNLINSNDGGRIYYTPRSQFDSEHDKDKDQKRKKRKEKKQQHRHKTTKCLWLFKKFKSRGKRFDGWNKRCRQWHWQK